MPNTNSQASRPEIRPGNVTPLPTRGESPPPSDRIRKSDLKRLIESAAAGDEEAASRLISPFVAPEEKLLMHGISAKFGLFPTYDFYFLTDRRIGDLEITPLTGNLNVEVAFIQKLDAFVLIQPSFPILFRLTLGILYLVFPAGFFGAMHAVLSGALGFRGVVPFVISVAVALGGVYLVYAAVVPAFKRAFLRLKKSGLWLKLQGNPVGILIFADRDKFELLTSLTRALSDVKRHLDKVSN